MSSRLQNTTIIIPPAAGSGASLTPSCRRVNLSGAFFFCKAASAPFKMQYDSGTPFDCEAGFYDSGDSFASLNFYNFNPWPITVTAYVGAAGIGYSGTLLSKNLATYILANLGLATTQGYIVLNGPGGGLDSGPGNQNSPLLVPGINNGNQRKLLSVCNVGTGSGNWSKPVFICDLAGQPFASVPSTPAGDMGGVTMVFEISGSVLIKSYGAATQAVIIGEIYYAA